MLHWKTPQVLSIDLKDGSKSAFCVFLHAFNDLERLAMGFG
jgi:hypothetical protein